MQNLYDVLGVPRTATAAEIDAAYRRIAKATHPDLHGDSPENLNRFRAATEAYAILSDSIQRARYDATDSFDKAQAAARMAELIATIAAVRAQAAELKQAAKAEVIKGVAWFAGGALITFLGFLHAINSPEGGHYPILWGAIVFGGWQAVRAFIAYRRIDSHAERLENEIIAKFEASQSARDAGYSKAQAAQQPRQAAEPAAKPAAQPEAKQSADSAAADSTIYAGAPVKPETETAAQPTKDNVAHEPYFAILGLGVVFTVVMLAIFAHNTPTNVPTRLETPQTPIPIENAQEHANIGPGEQPYIPTRIEWLALDLQTKLPNNNGFSALRRFSIGIGPDYPDTILIVVCYYPDVDRQLMKTEIENYHKAINIRAKKFGWDNWVKIREDVRLFDPNKQ